MDKSLSRQLRTVGILCLTGLASLNCEAQDKEITCPNYSTQGFSKLAISIPFSSNRPLTTSLVESIEPTLSNQSQPDSDYFNRPFGIAVRDRTLTLVFCKLENQFKQPLNLSIGPTTAAIQPSRSASAPIAEWEAQRAALDMNWFVPINRKLTKDSSESINIDFDLYSLGRERLKAGAIGIQLSTRRMCRGGGRSLDQLLPSHVEVGVSINGDSAEAHKATLFGGDECDQTALFFHIPEGKVSSDTPRVHLRIDIAHLAHIPAARYLRGEVEAVVSFKGGNIYPREFILRAR